MTPTSLFRPPLIVGVYGITCICGLIDAACYLGLGHVFAEVMTGNLLYLCFSLGYPGFSLIAPPVVALSSFAVGAVFAGRLLYLEGWWYEHRVGFAVEWAAVAGAVVATALLHPTPTNGARFVVFSLLAFAMGIQNALMRRWGVPDLATNVITLTLTGLISESTLAGGRNERWQRRASSIVMFAGSAILGAFLLHYGVLWPLLLALLVFSAALPILLTAEGTAAR
jgi:uncharacterized membrane protein YoaK (UPF0700 family)